MGRSNNTKERILDVAEQMFAHNGFAAASITDIASEVGIRGPGVYKHYPNKLAIYEAVLERLFTPMAGVVERMSTGATPEDILHQLQVILNHHLHHPSISRLIQHATLSGGETLELLANRWYKPFFNFIRQVAADDDNEWIDNAGIMAAHSMILGYVTLAPLHREIFGFDPMSEEQVSQQRHFYQRMVQNLSSGLEPA